MLLKIHCGLRLLDVLPQQPGAAEKKLTWRVAQAARKKMWSRKTMENISGHAGAQPVPPEINN